MGSQRRVDQGCDVISFSLECYTGYSVNKGLDRAEVECGDWFRGLGQMSGNGCFYQWGRDGGGVVDILRM